MSPFIACGGAAHYEKGAFCNMKTKCLRYGITSLYIIFTLSLLVLASCGGAAEETGGSITLSADPASIPPDGYSSSTITATVKDSTGNPVVIGTTVTFTTNLGSFRGSSSISVSISDDTGVVTVSLIAGTTSGIATVTAESNSVTQLIKVPIVSGGSTASITLTAEPTSIPPDGYSSSTITATLKDNTNNPVAIGTTVTLTTNLGSFHGSTSISVSTSDSTGIVTVSLIAGTTTGTATITAESNNVTQLVTVTIVSGGGTALITLEAEPECIAPDGFSSSTITATLYDSSGDEVPVGTYVTFTTNLGSFPGGTSAYGWTSDDTGVVTVSLIAGTTSGRATVTATSNNVTQSVVVSFSANCEE